MLGVQISGVDVSTSSLTRNLFGGLRLADADGILDWARSVEMVASTSHR